MNDRQKATKVKCKHDESLTKQPIFEEYVFSKSIWVLLELVGRWTQHFTKIDQEKPKNERICIWNPMTTGFNCVNIDLTSSVWNFCHWDADIPPRKPSSATSAAMSKEKCLPFEGYNIEHSTQCLITRWTTSKFVRNTLLHIIFQLSSRGFIWWWNTVSHA